MTDRNTNLFDLLQDRISSPDGGQPAIFWQNRSLSWRQVEQAARRVAGGLRNLGIQPGDRIAIMLPNVPPYLFVQLGVHLLGAILVPIHIFTRGSELGYLLDDSEAKVLITWSGFRDVTNEAVVQTESIRHRIEIGSEDSEDTEGIIDFRRWMNESEILEGNAVGGGDDIAEIRYTAGVTGRPKGAMLSHANILYNSKVTLQSLRLRKQDKVLGAIPFYHPFGCTLQIYMVLRSGASLYIQSRFDPDKALEAIAAAQVTVMIGLPAHFAGLVDGVSKSEDAGSLTFAVSGGGPMDHTIMNRFENIFKTRFATVYGTCETSPTIAVNSAHLEETPREAWGRPVSDLEVRIVDEEGRELAADEIGEIIVRSPGVFKGYWNRPDATKLAVDKEGWFHTSDLGKIEINGHLFGVGRLQNRINKGGYSVYPREVEGVLNAHPSVYASAVIGVPDPQLGEEIVAYVVARGGMPVNEKELIQYCTERLAQYKSPKLIIVLEKLPRSPGGAILRRTLRNRRTPKIEQEYTQPVEAENKPIEQNFTADNNIENEDLSSEID